MLILAAYTANLASFLVVQAKSKSSFSSIAGAVRSNKKVCVADGSADEEWFRANFPLYDYLQSFNSGPTERAARLRDGSCDVATFAKFEYDFLRQLGSVNPDCSMQTVGEPLQNVGAGWMVLNDVKDSCTSLVRDVLGIWFNQMDLDGTLRNIIRRSLTPVEHCPLDVTVGNQMIAERSGQLKIQNMLGILSVHAAGVCTALLFHFLSGAPKVVKHGIERTRSFRSGSPRKGADKEDSVRSVRTASFEAWEGDGELR